MIIVTPLLQYLLAALVAVEIASRVGQGIDVVVTRLRVRRHNQETIARFAAQVAADQTPCNRCRKPISTHKVVPAGGGSAYAACPLGQGDA